MAGNGDPAEISQVLCLKRIIIVVGWDRYVQMSLTILSLLMWLMLPYTFPSTVINVTVPFYI